MRHGKEVKKEATIKLKIRTKEKIGKENEKEKDDIGEKK